MDALARALKSGKMSRASIAAGGAGRSAGGYVTSAREIPHAQRAALGGEKGYADGPVEISAPRMAEIDRLKDIQRTRPDVPPATIVREMAGLLRRIEAAGMREALLLEIPAFKWVYAEQERNPYKQWTEDADRVTGRYMSLGLLAFDALYDR